MSGWNPLTIGPFLSMEVLCGFSKMIKNVGIIRVRAGQLGESGEYWMGRRMSALLSIRSSKVVAPACVD
jgi:hypothetical protein